MCRRYISIPYFVLHYEYDYRSIKTYHPKILCMYKSNSFYLLPAQSKSFSEFYEDANLICSSS